MGPVIQVLTKSPDLESFVCVTAQHREMLDQVLAQFGIVPDLDLDIMRPMQTLASLTAAVFAKLDSVIQDMQPDWVLIQGDTTTTMVAAMLSYYHHVKIGHIEAGLRTGDKWQPFPEEINRKTVGAIADLHFAATQVSKENLLSEGIPEDKIIVTGNPVIDAMNLILSKPYDITSGPLAELPLTNRIVLVTAHRRENIGDPLEHICIAMKKLSELVSDVHFVFPVHPNPNIKNVVAKILGNNANISLLPPLDYQTLMHLLSLATLVITDSGGLQEEAPRLGVPVLILRELTERPEGIAAGVARLIGTDTETIVRETQRILDNPTLHADMAKATNIYGDGQAADRIVKALLNYPNITGTEIS